MNDNDYIFAEGSGPVSVPRVTISTTAPSLICQKIGTSYGSMYLSFSDENNNVILGVRSDKTNGYRFHDLSQDTRVRARSDTAPSMCFFNKKLYIAWKPLGGTSISYQRTADINGKWDWQNPKQVEFNGSDVVIKGDQGPAIGATSNMLYVAWLDPSTSSSTDVDIWFSSSTNGVDWSQQSRQNLIIDGSTTTIKSHCPPFLLPSGRKMSVFWCAYDPPPNPPPTYKDPVYETVLDLKHTVTVNDTIVDVKNPVGVCGVSDDSDQWVFATDPDGTTWVDEVPRVGVQVLSTVQTTKAIAAAFVSDGEICVIWTSMTGELKEIFFTTTK